MAFTPNEYTEEQASKLRRLFAEAEIDFPLNKIPAPTLWRVLIMPHHVTDEYDTKQFEALSKLNQGKGLLKHEGTKRAQHYNRAHGHVVAVGPMYGGRHAPHIITDYEDGTPKGQRPIFPRFPSNAVAEIGDHVTLGKWSGQYLEAEHEGKVIKFKVYNDDEVLAVIDDDVTVKTKTQEELAFVPSDFMQTT